MTRKNAEQFIEWIRARDGFIVVGHISPDGDTLGSILALHKLLKMMGKRAQMICQDEVPRMYGFLPGVERIRGAEALSEAAGAMILVDIAALDRAGDQIEKWIGKFDCAVIDHHVTNEGFVPIAHIDPDASSTGEMVAELYDLASMPIDREAAIDLYAAIASDTGNFGFSNTTPAALRITARLVEEGLPIDELNQALFHVRSLKKTQLMGRTIRDMMLSSNDRVVISALTEEAFSRYGATHEDTEGIINVLKEIEGVQVAILLQQQGDATKASLRSDGSIHVGLLAQSFGGGGHERAAGCTLLMSVHEAADRLLKVVEDALMK